MFAFVAMTSFGCDQVSKEFARTRLEPFAPVTLLSGAVELRLAENRGAFLSLGAALPDPVRTVAFQAVVPVVLVGLCGLLLRRADTRQAAAIALILGGGAGNWIDRVLNEGAVTDFVRMGFGRVHTGIFNLADVAIVLGALLLLMQTTSRHAPEHPTAPAGSSDP